MSRLLGCSASGRVGEVPEVHGRGRDLERQGHAMLEAGAQLPCRQPLFFAPARRAGTACHAACHDRASTACKANIARASGRLRASAGAQRQVTDASRGGHRKSATDTLLLFLSASSLARLHPGHTKTSATMPRCAIRVSTASAGASDAGLHRAAHPWAAGILPVDILSGPICLLHELENTRTCSAVQYCKHTLNTPSA